MAEGKGNDRSEKGDHTLSLQPLSDTERDQAQQATKDFEKGAFDAVVGPLNKLAAARSNDPKITHNKAVLEYYRSGLKKTEEFKRALSSVCVKAQVNLDSVAALDDVDQCVVYYNHAVILYHLKRYHQALVIMDKLFQFIEPMEESLARKVTFLLLELYLCTQQPEKAMGLLAFIEKNIFGNGKAQSPDKDAGKGEPSKETTQNAELWKPKFSQFKARVYIMLKSLKTCKRELKNLMNTMGNICPVVYLKSNFEYLRGNYKKAIKVLNSAPAPSKPPVETGEHIPTMYYNNMAAIHFYLHKHHLGAFYLRRALQENENITMELLGKVDTAKSVSGKPIQVYSISRHYELLYNMGIQLLHCGKPQAAFDCLVEVVQVYHVNPRLWVRLAECCIMAHRASNEEDRNLGKRLQVIQRSVGSGIHRKLILGTGVKDHKTSSHSPAMPVATLEFASLCLRNALLLLPPDGAEGTPPPPVEEPGEAGKAQDGVSLAAPPGNPIRGADIATLRCSVLCELAYVELCLNDYSSAKEHAERLLKQSCLSGAQRYLGHMYLAEALVALDHIADAVSHLNPDNVTDINTVPPQVKPEPERSDKNGEKDGQEVQPPAEAQYPWTPSDLPQAKALMQYNLATAYTIRGEYEKASMTLTKSAQHIGSPLPAQMYFLKLYLELMEGRRKTAQAIIKDHFGHITPNRM